MASVTRSIIVCFCSGVKTPLTTSIVTSAIRIAPSVSSGAAAKYRPRTPPMNWQAAVISRLDGRTGELRGCRLQIGTGCVEAGDLVGREDQMQRGSQFVELSDT